MLTDVKIKALKAKEKPYKVWDRGGLYLLITPAGGKLWRMDYRFAGKRKTLALGKYPLVGLADARDRVQEARKMLAKGIDPALVKKAGIQAQRDTFGAIAAEWFERMKGSWAPSHSEKIRNRLDRWLLPWLKDIPIKEITAPLILQCARRAEEAGRLETAHRIIQLAGQVIRYAVATGRVEHDPTPSLRGALPPAPERHYPAPTDPEVLAEILRAIWAYEGSLVVGAALKTLVYTFQRPGEVRHMKWDEVDMEAGEWRFTVSKTKQEHLVPLSRQAVEILQDLQPLTGSTPWVFASLTRKGRPITNMTINRALQTMGFSTKDDITGHGFRATARTLLHERLNFPPEVIEHQLAHRVPDPLGTAYNRTKFLDQRRVMMQLWADYLDKLRTGEEAKVISFPKAHNH